MDEEAIEMVETGQRLIIREATNPVKVGIPQDLLPGSSQREQI
jgi:hypothetical protein